MNSDYFKNFLNLKEQNKATYESCLERISKSFEELKLDHNNNACFKFEYELQTLKDFRELKAKDKQIFYKCTSLLIQTSSTATTEISHS